MCEVSVLSINQISLPLFLARNTWPTYWTDGILAWQLIMIIIIVILIPRILFCDPLGNWFPIVPRLHISSKYSTIEEAYGWLYSDSLRQFHRSWAWWIIMAFTAREFIRIFCNLSSLTPEVELIFCMNLVMCVSNRYLWVALWILSVNANFGWIPNDEVLCFFGSFSGTCPHFCRYIICSWNVQNAEVPFVD